MTTLYAYKYLNLDGTPCNGGSGKWSLPRGKQLGKWMPPIKELIPCLQGYHLCRAQDLLQWYGPVLALAEYRGETIVHEDSKLVVEQARIVQVYDTWNERTRRLCACDCAERVLHFFEEAYPEDRRPREAIDVARRFANGQATSAELAAARAAAEAAAWAAAEAAAGAAARAAAGAAAGAAAWAAAKAAERQWQTMRLLDYLEGRDMGG